MIQKRFGSADTTGRKLDVIGEYLSMYQKALGNTNFETLYIDGFAGSGEVPLAEHTDNLFDEDVRTVIAGSADRALNVDPPFARYIFIDKRRKCIDALKAKFKDSPNAERVNYSIGDANEHIQKICRAEQWRSQRGVILLDPFGSQVRWETIEAVAATKALDLWYLFPAGLGVFRQISNDGTVDQTHEASITRIYGTDAWKTAFFEPSKQTELFGEPVTKEKVVTPESAALFMIERLKRVFEGGVMDEMIPLGKHAYPSYYLLFAWGNASPKAKALANRLSKAAVKATDRKHGRIV
ncbi:MAG: three-Cys-motif partner protein TcmP [Alphaproteobacteria bacterium]|nr:three-Cys-motif partner protein TcmP [Alphaproteobacteria bacterium]